jgi:RNA polymerase sigma-70 factor (ECF subfamily)
MLQALDKRSLNLSDDRNEMVEVTERILENRISIHGFILALVHDPHVAEDVFQEVCMTICLKWKAYDPERPFRPWALGIAYNKAMKHFERAKRRRVLLLDPELAEEIIGHPEWEEERIEERDALRECMKRLSDTVRRMLRMKYADNLSLKEIGRNIGWNAKSVSVALARARRTLMECIDRRTRAEAG